MGHKKKIYEIIDTPYFFNIMIVSSTDGLEMVNFIDKKFPASTLRSLSIYSEALIKYFKGEKINFIFPISFKDFSSFDLRVFEEVKKIEYGCTKTYKDIAISLGNAKLARAIGNSLRRNPIPIIIPCHRVIGSDGKLKGFMGKKGLEIKRALLLHEQKFLTLKPKFFNI